MKMLVEIIRREMAARGILSFARFMELALYCPVYGYYETKKDNPGRHGDFYTNVSVSELFGQLLAFQFVEWLEVEVRSQRSEVRIVEAGAHDGQLAKDILNWLQSSHPKLFEQIQYAIIEPSARRQEWQKEKLAEFTPRVRWFSDFGDLKLKTQNWPVLFSQTNFSMPCPFAALAGMPNKKSGLNGVFPSEEKNSFGRKFPIRNPQSAIRNWKPCFPTAIPSKPAPPLKTGGARPRVFWNVAG